MQVEGVTNGNRRGLLEALALAILALASSPSVWAKEEFTPCVPIPGQYRRVHIPPEVRRLLMEDDRKGLGTDAIAAGWKSNNPNNTDIYLGYMFDLNHDGYSDLLIRTNPDSNGAHGHNNPVWVVGRTKAGYKIMFSGEARPEGGPIALKSETNGYKDICIVISITSSEQQIIILSYTHDHEYSPRQCRTLIYGSDDHISQVRMYKCSIIN